MRKSSDADPRGQRRWETARRFIAVGRFLLWLISWAAGPDPLEGPATA